MKVPTAERIAEIRALMKDLDASPPARLTVSEASHLVLVTNTLLGALDYVAERLAAHEQSKPQTSYGVHRELIAYIGAPAAGERE